MSASLARTADGWWVVTPAGLVPLGLTAATTAQLLGDRGRPGPGRQRRAGRRRHRPAGGGPGRLGGPAQPGDRPGAGGGAGGELPVPRPGLRPGPGQTTPGLLPQGLALPDRAHGGYHPARRGRIPGLRGGTRPGHRRRPARRHHGDRREPGPLRRRPGRHQRHQRPPDPAHQDPVLRGQVLSHVHSRRGRG